MNRQQRRFAERRNRHGSSPATPSDDMFRAAVSLHEAGQLLEAAEAYRHILNSNPRHAQALYLAGVVELTLGRADSAHDLIGQALRVDDRNAQYFCQFANACALLGRSRLAIRSYHRAIALRPDYAEAHANLGDALSALGNYASAANSYDRAIEIDPKYAEAWCNRGNTLRSLGRLNEAVASYDRAVSLRPDMAGAWGNRGIGLLDQGHHDCAIASFDRALLLDPTMAQAWHSRGVALAQAGRLPEAVESYDRALAIQPNWAEAWSDRGASLFEMERTSDALSCYSRAISLRPELAEAWYNRGNALKSLRDFTGAIESFDRAIALKPDHCDALGERVHLRYLICDWRHRQEDDALLTDLVRNGQRVAPFILLPASVHPEDQLHCARNWSGRFPNLPVPLARPRAPNHERRITIGYVSGDFRQHPLAYLTADVFKYHQRPRFRVVCYSLRPDDGSAIRQRLLGACDQFVDLSATTDPVAAETIAKDGTDILVDLTGHTSSARTGVIARRPAPIQVSYLGYIGSMGAPFIDYVLADSVALPMEQQQYYDEKIVHLPVSYQPNSSTREMPDRSYSRSDCGLPQDGFVFCCFNTSYKISPNVFGLWMRLLASVQGSVLWLVGTNPLAEANLRREATGHGIDPARLLFAPRASYSDYLARCSVADLFLDTCPYSAGATASDALWAGLPLITRMGRDFAGRMAASVLTAVGLSELITQTDAEYERLARRLATEPAEMRRIRAALRERKRTSGVFDAVRGTRHLEAAYDEMWRRHCAGETPDNFVVSEGKPGAIFTT